MTVKQDEVDATVFDGQTNRVILSRLPAIFALSVLASRE